ncbi:hypothetical protein ACVILL_001950 [Bradyrhizobium sp. USDA 3364]
MRRSPAGPHRLYSGWKWPQCAQPDMSKMPKSARMTQSDPHPQRSISMLLTAPYRALENFAELTRDKNYYQETKR